MIRRTGFTKDGRVCILVLVFVSALMPCEMAGAMIRNPEKANAKSGRRVASCILRAASHDEMLPLSEDVLTALMMTTSVRGDATRTVLHRGAAEDLDNNYIVTTIDTIHDGNLMDNDSVKLLRLHVSLDELDANGEEIPPRADELLDAIVARLRNATIELAKSNDATLRARLALTEMRSNRAREELHQLIEKRRAISERASRIDLTRETLVDEIQSLEAHRRDVALERAAHEARRAAIEQLIASTTLRLSSASENDAILSELSELQKGHEHAIARMKALVDGGAAPEYELIQAQDPLHQLRIRIAERREELAARAGGDDLASLNRELIQLSITSAEMEARSLQLKARLEGLRPLLPLADEMEREVQIRLPAAQEAVQLETERLRFLMTLIETRQPPQLDIVGDSNVGKK